jgi:putative endopeptidase
MRPAPLLAASAATVMSLTAAAQSSPAPTGGPAATHGINLADMDRSVAPGDDFFRYANGTWLKTTPIPADQSAWGTSAILTELTAQRVAALIRESAAASPGSEGRKIGDYYASFLDEAAIEARGTRPLDEELKRIEAIRDHTALSRALGQTVRADVDVLNNTVLATPNLFGLWVAQDLDDPTHYSPFLLQGGLTMPDRDYYLSPEKRMGDIRAKYLAHIAAVLTLLHLPQPQERAARVFALEHAIAEVHASVEDSEDVQKGNNHWRREEFQPRAPGLEWQAFFAGAGLGRQEQFVVWQPHALAGISALTKSTPLEIWKDFLRFHLAESASDYLPRAFAEEHFNFQERVILGTPEMAPRWKRAVAATNAALGMAVGKLYVQRYFPATEKARAEAMVHNLIAAFAARIDRLEWMAPQTRAEAKAKLAALKVGVGYPDHWRDYGALEVVKGEAYGNFVRAELFEYQRNLAKLTQPVDRSEWVMNPQLVNAVNLPAMNALNFPAGILQPPKFDPAADPVSDYGDTGATIGHEISHSFDDTGAQFDAQGRLRNWWTAADFQHFKAATRQLAEQYDAYRPFPDLHVNGKQTLGENMADLAGLTAAYDAWHMTLSGKPAPSAQGFSGEQLFFLSYAQSWRTEYREARLRQRIISNVHAPAEFRADTVRNLDAWYEAFGVKTGEKLYLAPAQRVRIW